MHVLHYVSPLQVRCGHPLTPAALLPWNHEKSQSVLSCGSGTTSASFGWYPFIQSKVGWHFGSTSRNFTSKPCARRTRPTWCILSSSSCENFSGQKTWVVSHSCSQAEITHTHTHTHTHHRTRGRISACYWCACAHTQAWLIGVYTGLLCALVRTDDVQKDSMCVGRNKAHANRIAGTKYHDKDTSTGMRHIHRQTPVGMHLILQKPFHLSNQRRSYTYVDASSCYITLDCSSHFVCVAFVRKALGMCIHRHVPLHRPTPVGQHP